MQPTIERVRLAGRPPIGPKAQAAIDPAIYQAVAEEAEERGCKKSDVWRELIELGWSVRNGDR